ncbi:hypothetical protein ABBQ32_000827 [Trebouxia sp. C0010 RCD-2024]
MVTAAHQPSGSAAALSLTAELPGRRPHDLKGFMFPSTPHWLIKKGVKVSPEVHQILSPNAEHAKVAFDGDTTGYTQELTREGKGNNLAMQLLYILKHTMHDTQAVGDREKLYFSALHAAFVKKYPGQEHDVVTWAKNYNLAASGQPLDLLSTISGKIVEWSGCAVQQPSTSQRSKPVAGADANSQYQLQHENQARSLL